MEFCRAMVHGRHAGRAPNIISPHIRHIFKIMPLFQIGVTFFEYAAWIYSGMSAVVVGG
jgi:hypothetical protein